MIDSNEKLNALLPRLRTAEWVALDTEADSLYAYPEKVCLLQISFPGADVLVDPLTNIDLNLLWPVLTGRELILHGSDYDLRLLSKWHGFVPHKIFDTMIAARLLGMERFSLDALTQQILEVKLEKGSQKANWAERPLSPKMEAYARNDTHYLRPLEDKLRSELVQKGRLAWHEETCARLIVDCANPEPPDLNRVWRVKGANVLSPAALAVLRAMWHWREEEALSARRPPFFVLSHELLLRLAVAAVERQSLADLIPKRFPDRRRDSLTHAIRLGLSVPPSHHPQPLRHESTRLTETQRRRLQDLEARRDKVAGELKIDPSLVASRATLLEVSRVGIESSDGMLMRWQRELLS